MFPASYFVTLEARDRCFRHHCYALSARGGSIHPLSRNRFNATVTCSWLMSDAFRGLHSCIDFVTSPSVRASSLVLTQ